MPTLRRFLRDDSGPDTDAVRAELHGMLPGMLVEQTAAVILENVNVYVMGFISTAALAGVSQVTTINNILMNLFQAFATGGTVMVARCAGAGKRGAASRYAASALVLGLSVSLLLSALFFAFGNSIIHLLFHAAEQNVLDASQQFFRLTCLTPPLWFVYFQCCGYLRCVGDTKRPMLVSILLNGVSILGNLVFVGALGMGVTGSALAYLLSVAIGAMISLAMVLRKSFSIRPSFRSGNGQEASAHSFRTVARIAVPASVENLMFNGSRIFIQIFLSGMGTVMISGNQVFNSVTSILMVPVMSLYYLTIPLVARCTDGGDEAAIRRAADCLYDKTMRWSLITGAAHLLLALPLSWLFTRDPAVLRVGVVMLAAYSPSLILQADSFILPNVFKAAGDVKYAMVLSSLTAWGIRVLGTWFFGIVLGMRAYAIVLTQVLDYLVRTFFYHRRYLGQKWLSCLQIDYHDRRRIV